MFSVHFTSLALSLVLAPTFIAAQQPFDGPEAADVDPVGTECTIDPDNTGTPQPCNPDDPPFTQNEDDMFNNIQCEGATADVQYPYLLVPGTGNTGSDSFSQGYVPLVGQDGLGFDACFLKEEDNMLGDASLVAERIAYAMNALATLSGKKVIAQGWSQGNLDIQFAMTFYTSARSNTDRFISLAGDFKGTTLAVSPAPIGILQQADDAKFVGALADGGGLKAQVPTTTIYSDTDEVIRPENGVDPDSTSFLEDAGLANIQSFCPGLAVSHGEELFFNVPFQATLQAIQSANKIADLDTLQAADIPCNSDAANGLNGAQVAFTKAAITKAGTNIATGGIKFTRAVEPDPPAFALSDL